MTTDTDPTHTTCDISHYAEATEASWHNVPCSYHHSITTIPRLSGYRHTRVRTHPITSPLHQLYAPRLGWQKLPISVSLSLPFQTQILLLYRVTQCKGYKCEKSHLPSILFKAERHISFLGNSKGLLQVRMVPHSHFPLIILQPETRFSLHGSTPSSWSSSQFSSVKQLRTT